MDNSHIRLKPAERHLGHRYEILDVVNAISHGFADLQAAADPQGRLTEKLIFIDSHRIIPRVPLQKGITFIMI
jgi:hypothetical protein